MGTRICLSFLSGESLVSHEDVWPFGKGPSNTAAEPLENVRALEHVRRTRRLRAWLGFLWLGVWILFGVALAASIITPVALWLVGGGELLRSVWLTFSTSRDGLYWTGLVVSIFLGLITGTPVAVFWSRRFLRTVLGFAEEEINALLASRPKSGR